MQNNENVAVEEADPISLYCLEFQDDLGGAFINKVPMTWRAQFPAHLFPRASAEFLLDLQHFYSTNPDNLARLSEMTPEMDNFEDKTVLLAVEKFEIAVMWRGYLCTALLCESIDTVDRNHEKYLKLALPILTRFEEVSSLVAAIANSDPTFKKYLDDEFDDTTELFEMN